MVVSESIEDFYKTHPAAKRGSEHPLARTFQHGHFNVFSRKFCNRYNTYSRRDYYKISLILGKGNLIYGDTKIEINQNALVFFNRNVPYSWETSPEQQSGYVYKYDLIKNHVNLIIHEALKMQSSQAAGNHTNGSRRIASCFSELLERQFPIDSPEHKLQLRTAKDYAQRLSIHINHLNRALKEVTGKITTEHITERLIKESKILLKKSYWSVTEIAYCLGFEYPEYFNNLFKKQTGITPNSFRK